MEDPRFRVCLDRTIELESVRLKVREWPGLAGPLIHVPDPLQHVDDDTVISALAALAPAYRVLSVAPRLSQPYQVAASDLVGLLDQFGFVQPILVGQGLGCLPTVLVAAWHPGHVARVALVDQSLEALDSDRLEGRAVRDCPPDWPALLSRIDCPVLDLHWDASAFSRLYEFLSS